jgi:hypothetical protein
MGSKLLKHKILSRHKHMHLIAEMILESVTAPHKAWSQLDLCLMPSLAGSGPAEVMPDA